MYEKMFFIAGFPRTGSTLLSSILCQNNNIHIEGKSALCQLMWDMQNSILTSEKILLSNDKEDFKNKIIKDITKIYYENNSRPIVFDKNPFWTNINNQQMIFNHLDKNYKMIVLYRSMVDILKSLVNIYRKNNLFVENIMINTFPELISLAEDFFKAAEQKEKNRFLFIQYDDIVRDTSDVINKIYNFFEIDYFQHNYINIKKYPATSDNFFNLKNLYSVRPEIKKINNDVIIDSQSLQICKKIDDKIQSYKDKGLC